MQIGDPGTSGPSGSPALATHHHALWIFISVFVVGVIVGFIIGRMKKAPLKSGTEN